MAADGGRTGKGADDVGEVLLEVEGLKKHFDQSDGPLDRLLGGVSSVKAVDGVDMELRRGETLAVVGESGCGKSTLARTLLNLHHATAGEVRFDGDPITGLPESEMRPYRRRMSMVFQDPLASLNPRHTVGSILKRPLKIHGIGGDADDRDDRVRELLERVGLKSGYVDRYPQQFSGGQQQRVGIARALAVEPELLVADEPVSALDVSVQAQILNLLEELQEELNLAMLFIAHDLSVVRYVADRVAVMYLGEVVETAPVEELFENPKHPYTQSLLSAVPRIDPEDRGDRVVLEGTVPSPINPPAGCRFHTRCPSVIPPDEWAGDSESFRRGFRFRTRVEDGELDPGAAVNRLKAEGREIDPEMVAEQLVESAMPGGTEMLPASATEAVFEAARAVVEGDEDRAREIVTEAFPSPCVDRKPEIHGAGPDHDATCHRLAAEYEDPTIVTGRDRGVDPTVEPAED